MQLTHWLGSGTQCLFHNGSPRAMRGVYLVFFALVLATVMGLVGGLGYRSLLIRNTAVLLRAKSDEVCINSASHPTQARSAAFAHSVLKAFRTEVGLMAVPRTTITSAKIVIPQFHDQRAHNEIDFSPCGAVPVCKAQFAVSHYNMTDRVPGGPLYPKGVWEADQSTLDDWEDINGDNVPASSVGNTIACEFNAQVSAPFFGTQTLRVVSMFASPPRGLPGSGQAISPFYTPGLVIAIAPQMETNSMRKDFRFSPTLPGAVGFQYSDNPASDSSPLFPYKTAAPNDAAPVVNFKMNVNDPLSLLFDTRGASGVPLGAFSQNYPGEGNVGTGIPPIAAPSWTSSGSTPIGDGSAPQADPGVDRRDGVFSDREELLIACVNKHSVVRNLMLTGIIEHLMRNGSFRRSTEILMVNSTWNPASQTRIDNYAAAPAGIAGIAGPAAGLGPMPPTRLIDFGDDLASFDKGGGNYVKMPFALFDPDLHPNPGHSCVGVSCNPVNGTGNPASTAARKQFHSLLLNQLRICAHLYASPDAADDGSPTLWQDDTDILPPLGLSRPFDWIIGGHLVGENKGVGTFAGADTIEALTFGNRGGPGLPAVLGRSVSDAYPVDRHPARAFVGGGGVRTGAWAPPLDSTLHASTTFSASEAVGMLGSVQTTPYRATGLGNYATSGVPCVGEALKSGAGMGGPARPDLVGLLTYLSGAGAGAFPSPGMRLNAGSLEFMAQDPRHADSAHAPIVIVLHQSLPRDPSKPADCDSSSNTAQSCTYDNLFLKIRDLVNEIQGRGDAAPPEITVAESLDPADGYLKTVTGVTSVDERWYRPITLVYIPTSLEGLQPGNIRTLMAAFYIPRDQNDTNNEAAGNGNRIYIFSPYLDKYRGTLGDGFGPDDAGTSSPTTQLSTLAEMGLNRYSSLNAAFSSMHIYTEAILRQFEARM